MLQELKLVIVFVVLLIADALIFIIGAGKEK